MYVCVCVCVFSSKFGGRGGARRGFRVTQASGHTAVCLCVFKNVVIAVVTLAGVWQGSWMFCMSPLQEQGHVQGCPWGGGGAKVTAHKGLLLLKQLWVICCTCHLPDQRDTAM